MAASYPTSVKTFSAFNAGDTIQDTHIEDAYDELVALEQALLSTGLAHNLFPDATANNRDLGTSAKQWRDLYLARGIQFPATQNPSSDANLLDDYEEGTWTPTLGELSGQSGQAYSVQVGRYVKIGKQVFVQGRITLSTLGTITNDAQIQGLPFTSESTTNLWSTATIWWAAMTSSLVYAVGIQQPGTTVINLYRATAASATLGVFVQADFANTSDLIFSCVYRAAN